MRRYMTSTLGAILVLAVVTFTANAANFTNTFFGISIDVDDALTKQPLLRDIQYFKSEDRSASLMIKRIFDLSVTEFVAEMRDVGYRNMRDHVVLGMAGEPIEADIESGRGLLIPVTGRIRGHQVRGVLGAYSGHDGQGFLVIGTARPQSMAAWDARMKAIFDSVRFVEIDSKAMVSEWETWLMGKKLQHQRPKMPRPAAGGPQRDYYLCSDGTVMRKPAPARQVAGPNMGAQNQRMNQGRGTWQVTASKGTPYLMIRDGREQRLMLEVEGSNLLLNGERYISAANDLCQ